MFKFTIKAEKCQRFIAVLTPTSTHKLPFWCKYMLIICKYIYFANWSHFGTKMTEEIHELKASVKITKKGK